MIYKINKRVLIEENLLNHFRDNKNAYLAGAAGLGAAGLGTYLAMSSGDHTGLDNHDKERELQQKLDAANEYDSGIRVGAPLALAGGAALVHLGLSAATGGKTAQNIANGVNFISPYAKAGLNYGWRGAKAGLNYGWRGAKAGVRAGYEEIHPNGDVIRAQREARKKAAETPSTKYNPPRQPRQPRQPRANSKI
jgi:hypothetical protein